MLPRIIKDHLGSIRVTLDQSGNIDSWTDYYPFGKESRSSGNSANEQKEHFTGKERDYEIGLDYFGARYYNSEIGRWLAVDPHASKGPQFSPYAYTFNNPILLVDPTGKWPTWIHNKIIDRALGTAFSTSELKVFQKASDYTDTKPGAQTSESSYLHAMSKSSSREGKAEAKEKMEQFINSKIDEFVNKDGEDALFALGEGMHAVMDMTSPSHEGFQQWDDIQGKDMFSKGVAALGHLVRELNIFGESNEEVDAAVYEVQNYVEKALNKKKQKQAQDANSGDSKRDRDEEEK